MRQIVYYEGGPADWIGWNNWNHTGWRYVSCIPLPSPLAREHADLVAANLFDSLSWFERPGCMRRLIVLPFLLIRVSTG